MGVKNEFRLLFAQGRLRQTLRGRNTSLLFYSNAAFFTCDASLNNAMFTSTGFSYYRVRIFDRWGEKVYDMIGYIDEIATLYASGNEISTNISQGLFTVQLELFNCSYHKIEAFSLLYEYVDPCVSAALKKEDNTLVVSEYTEQNHQDVKLYPNPSSGLVNLCYSVDNSKKIHFIISDQLGRIVYEKEDVPVLNKNQMHVIPTDYLANGNYYVTLFKDNKKIVKKFTVQR